MSKRILEGTQPTMYSEFVDKDGVPATPTSMTYNVRRLDTNVIVASGSPTPAGTSISVLLPIAAVTLTTTDEDPVEMVYTLIAQLPGPEQVTDEVKYLVEPAVGV